MYTFEKLKKKQCESLTTQPIERASKIFGLNLFSPLGKLYNLFLIFSFIIIIYAATKDLCILNCEYNSVKSFLIWLRYCTNTVLVFILLCSSWINSTQFVISRKDLDAIDNLLLSQNLQFPRVLSFRAQVLQLFFLLLMPLPLSMRCIFFVLNDHSFHILSYSIHYYFSVTITLVADCLFVNIMYMIRRRFSELNKLMIREGKKDRPMIMYLDFLARSNVALNNSGPITVPDTQTSRFLYHLLYEFAVKANADFGLHLLVSSAISLVTIINELYEIHEIFYKSNDNYNIQIVIVNLINALYYIGRLLFISGVCQRTKDESNLTTRILHDYFTDSQKNEVVHFSLQMIHENVVFTAFGFYEIDFGVICSILGAVTTYLVILMQLDISANTSKTKTVTYSDNVTHIIPNSFNLTSGLNNTNSLN